MTIDWFNVHRSCYELSRKIKKDIDVDSIVAIAKGGLVPASILCHYLKPKTFHTIGVSTYDDRDRKDDYTIYQSLPPSFPTKEEENILIVDDLSDSGRTFGIVEKEICKNNYFNCSIYTATPYIKDHLEVKPDYYMTEFSSDVWLVFPWEV